MDVYVTNVKLGQLHCSRYYTTACLQQEKTDTGESYQSCYVFLSHFVEMVKWLII